MRFLVAYCVRVVARRLHRKSRLRRLVRASAIAFAACGILAQASAQAASLKFSCYGAHQTSFQGTLCKSGSAGQDCTSADGNSFDDIEIIQTTDISAISFSFVGASGSSQVSLTGQGNTVTPPGNVVAVPPNASISATGDADNSSTQYRLEITSPPGAAKSLVTYAVSCDDPRTNSPSILLKKTSATPSYSAAGQTITYNLLVKNDGNRPLNNVAVVDTGATPSAGCSVPSLAPQASYACTATYVVKQADVDAGHYDNTATVTGTDPNGNQVSNQATASVPAITNTGLSIKKTANTASYQSVGQVLDYTLVVENVGNVGLTNIDIDDPNAVVGSCAPVALHGTLPAGQSTTCSAQHTVTQTDVTAGKVVNTATAKGTDPHNNVISSPPSTATVKLNDDFVREHTMQVVRNFLYRRTDQLLSNEPDRNRFIRRLPGALWGSNGETEQASAAVGSTFAASGGQGETTRIAFSTSLTQLAADARLVRQKNADSQRMGLGAGDAGSLKDGPLPTWNSGFDLWVEGHYTHFDDDQGHADRSGRLGLMYVGTDYLITRSLLVGALVQFDWMDDESKAMASTVNGQGWMAGPYATARLSEHLFLDARAAWGRSDNTINPFGLYEDSFTTERWLVRANLTGNWSFGDWRFTPSVSVARIEESQQAYSDSLGVAIPGQDVALGRVTFGPEIGHRFVASDGSIVEPHIALQGLWDFEKPDTLAFGSEIVSPDSFRGKVEAGVMLTRGEGASLRISGSYDGIGSADFSAYSGQLWVNLPLH